MFKKFLLKLLKFFSILYIILLIGLYFFQEKLFFHPNKIEVNQDLGLDKNFFEEVFVPVDKNVKLHGILSKLPNKSKIKLLLHGNGGTSKSWLDLIPSEFFLQDYNYFIFDYRSYGKSNGKITSEDQMFADIQIIYNFLKTKYSEDQIIIEGYSMGTGLATFLASQNAPHALILNAPYYSLLELSKEKVPIIPNIIVKYQFKTNEFLKKVKCPITIFHGNKDQIIPIEHSKRLKFEIPKIKFIQIANVAHMGIFNTNEYRHEMVKLN